MSTLLFAVAAVMLTYDASGHLCAAIAHWSARSDWQTGAILWNNYSTMIWPRITDQETYHWYWAGWHCATIAFFGAAFWLRH